MSFVFVVRTRPRLFEASQLLSEPFDLFAVGARLFGDTFSLQPLLRSELFPLRSLFGAVLSDRLDQPAYIERDEQDERQQDEHDIAGRGAYKREEVAKPRYAEFVHSQHIAGRHGREVVEAVCDAVCAVHGLSSSLFDRPYLVCDNRAEAVGVFGDKGDDVALIERGDVAGDLRHDDVADIEHAAHRIGLHDIRLASEQ